MQHFRHRQNQPPHGSMSTNAPSQGAPIFGITVQTWTRPYETIAANWMQNPKLIDCNGNPSRQTKHASKRDGATLSQLQKGSGSVHILAGQFGGTRGTGNTGQQIALCPPPEGVPTHRPRTTRPGTQPAQNKLNANMSTMTKKYVCG